MTLSKKQIDKAGVFTFGVVLLLAFCYYAMKSGAPHAESWSGFLEQPPDTIDVLIVGNSHAQCALAPMQIWQESKVTSWNFNAGGANNRHKQAFFEVALMTQKPKLVAFEMYSLQSELQADIAHNKAVYDGMPDTTFKYSAILATSREATQIPPLVFPPPAMHWTALGRGLKQVTLSSFDDMTYTGGALALIKGAADPAAGLQNDIEETDDLLLDENIEVLIQIAGECQRQGIPLLLWLAPVRNINHQRGFETVKQRIGDQYPDVAFLNMSEHSEEIGLTQDDFRDPGHLYLSGMKKTTTWWCDQVLSRYSFPEHTDGNVISWWDRNAQAWNEETRESVPQ